jgi:hypothetical protein
MNSCRPHQVSRKQADPLEEIVQTYMHHNAPGEERYLKFYRIQRTLADAVEKAAMAELPNGKRFSHQRRIPRAVLTKAKEALLKVDVKSCRNFDELSDLVRATIGPIRGIGELTIYDTAHRLGAHLRLSPEFVYIHAGVRVGLKALGLSHRSRKLSMHDLPPAFHRLTPEQVEDCLCSYKHELQQFAQSSRAESPPAS